MALPPMARLDRSCRRSNSSGSRVNRTDNRAVTVHPQGNAATSGLNMRPLGFGRHMAHVSTATLSASFGGLGALSVRGHSDGQQCRRFADPALSR
jgi:hypothetical protein